MVATVRDGAAQDGAVEEIHNTHLPPEEEDAGHDPAGPRCAADQMRAEIERVKEEIELREHASKQGWVQRGGG